MDTMPRLQSIIEKPKTRLSHFDLTPLEKETLLAIVLIDQGMDIPLNKDGFLPRNAFGRDLAKEILSRQGQTSCVQEQSGVDRDKDGAPALCVYSNLMCQGLIESSDGLCAFKPTKIGISYAAKI